MSRTFTLPSGDTPVGLVEIAAHLGVVRNTVDQWRIRESADLPSPRWTVGGRPAWAWADIEEWAIRTDRLRSTYTAITYTEPGTDGRYGVDLVPVDVEEADEQIAWYPDPTDVDTWDTRAADVFLDSLGLARAREWVPADFAEAGPGWTTTVTITRA